MCPVCIATAAAIASGITSTGGLTALSVRKFFTKSVTNESASQLSKENNHG